MKMLRTWALPLLFVLAACSGPNNDEIQVSNAWVRLPAIEDRPGAAYFTLRNNGPATALTGIESSQASKAELHMTHVEGTMTHMMPIDEEPIGEGESKSFEPGNNHAMLYGINPDVKPGGIIRLTFLFRDGRKAEADAKTVAMGDAAPGE